MASQDVALRKRQQIAKANRTMFLWVMGVSVLVGAAAVSSVFLAKKLEFNTRIIAEKNRTVATLVANNKTIESLKANVRELNTNQALLDSHPASTERPIQLVLDALPSDANAAALGASLQKILLRVDDVTIESLTFNEIGSQATAEVSAEPLVDTTGEASPTIAFSFEISAPSSKVDSLRTVLLRLERSIRAIDVQSLTIEMQGSKITLQANAVGFYEPAATVDLRDKTVEP